MAANSHVAKSESWASEKCELRLLNLLSFKICSYGSDFWPISSGDLNKILGAWNGFLANCRKFAIGFSSWIKIFENTVFGHVTEVPITSKVPYYVWKIHNWQTIKTPKKLQDGSMLEVNLLLTQDFMICVISWSNTPNLSSCINLVISKYKLKPQDIKLTQLWTLTANYVKVGSQCIWQACHKVAENVFLLHICRP